MDMEKPRLESSRGLSAQDEIKYRRKYKELKKRIREIEEENDSLTVKLHRARKNIQRLRIERNFLFERLEQTTMGENGGNTDSSEMSSDDVSHDSDMSDPPLDEHDRPLAGSSSSSSHRHHHHHHSKGSGRGGMLFDKSAAPRRKKDPNAPKRPGNVFFLYCRLEREKIKDEHPGENLGDLTKLLGQKWKSLSKDEKQKYYDAYKKEQEDWQNAMKTYTPPASGDKSRQHPQHNHQLQFAPPHPGMGGPMGGAPQPPHLQPPSFSSGFAPPQPSSVSAAPPPLRPSQAGPSSSVPPIGPPALYHPGVGFAQPAQHHQLPGGGIATTESTPVATPSRGGAPRGGSEMGSNVGDDMMDEELEDDDDELEGEMEEGEEEMDELEEANGAEEEEDDYEGRGSNGRNGRREEHREDMEDV